MRFSSSPFEILAVFARRYIALVRLAALLILTLALVLCWNFGKSREHVTVERYLQIPTSRETFNTDFPYLALSPLDQQTEQGNAAGIDLAKQNGGLMITEGGDYRLHGDMVGTLHILAKDAVVHLFLDGVSISSKIGPAVFCEEADKLVITILPGTDNYISDTGNYHGFQDADACIYSDCDLTINGSGSLKVSGYYKDAVSSCDVLKVIDADINVKCKRAGLRGNDGIVLYGGKSVISSEKNGLYTTKSGHNGRGSLVVTGGEHSVIAGRYAFVTDKADLYLFDCTVYNRSIIRTFHVAGMRYVQEGCVQ